VSCILLFIVVCNVELGTVQAATNSVAAAAANIGIGIGIGIGCKGAPGLLSFSENL